MTLSIDNYTVKNWAEYFSNDINLRILLKEKSWEEIFNKLFSDKKFIKLESYIKKCLNAKVNVLPFPELIFNAFNMISLDKVKVVIVGQDCYPKFENKIPQAMGLAFSVPIGLTIPSSLMNIYKNLKKYNHITQIPKHGNLEHLVSQGVLLINSALTVQENVPNSHQQYWEWFTDEIIKHIANYNEQIKFVLWGKHAINKINLLGKCEYIASSHPSGLSCNNPCGKYPAFDNSDFAKKLNLNWEIK